MFHIRQQRRNSAAEVSDIIKIDRLTARIDEPTSEATEIKAYAEDAEATEAEKKANEDAKTKVSKIELTSYAISNVANKTNVMQHWNDAKCTNLSIPEGTTYFQQTSEFGTKTLLKNYDYFNAVTTDKSHKDYVFENNSKDAATSMYFEYTVTLNKDLRIRQTSRMEHSIVTTRSSIATFRRSSTLSKIKRLSLMVRTQPQLKQNWKQLK